MQTINPSVLLECCLDMQAQIAKYGCFEGDRPKKANVSGFMGNISYHCLIEVIVALSDREK